MDFTQTPPGMLALDNMLYFAKHHQDAYIRVSMQPLSASVGFLLNSNFTLMDMEGLLLDEWPQRLAFVT